MALTIDHSSASYKGLDKLGRIFGLSSRGLRHVLITVTFGSTDDYTTNGVAADLAVDGIKELIEVIPCGNDLGVWVNYDLVNKKIIMRGDLNTATNAAALVELTNASTLTRSKKFRFLVIGR